MLEWLESHLGNVRNPSLFLHECSWHKSQVFTRHFYVFIYVGPIDRISCTCSLVLSVSNSDLHVIDREFHPYMTLGYHYMHEPLSTNPSNTESSSL